MYRITAACLSSMLLLAACGQSGDLYMPDDGKAKEVVGAASPAPAPVATPAQPVVPAAPAPSSPAPGMMDFDDFDFDDDDD